MNDRLTLPVVDGPTAGQMRRVSDFRAENAAAAGYRSVLVFSVPEKLSMGAQNVKFNLLTREPN